MMNALQSVSALAVLLAGVAATSSCSVRMEHGDGSATYLGMVRVNEPVAEAVPIRHVRRYGVIADAGIRQTGLMAGYADSLVVAPPNDTKLEFDYEISTRKMSGSAEKFGSAVSDAAEKAGEVLEAVALTDSQSSKPRMPRTGNKSFRVRSAQP